MSELMQIRTRRDRPQGGIALFEMGFRPFFLGAGAHAALSIPWWIAVYAGLLPFAGAGAPQWLHAHEMVFGFCSAAVAGFLLTATPSWTSSPPVAGAPLGALFLLWLCARALFLLGAPAPLLAALDLSFLPALCIALWPAMRRGKAKNLVFLALLTVMWLGNVLFHLQMLGLLASSLQTGLHLGAYAVVMMVTILSGRVVPGFTENALRRAGAAHFTTTTDPRVDLAAKACALCALGSHVAVLPTPLTAALALLASALLLLRMARWRSVQTFRDPLLWILHAGHALLVLGFLCMGLQQLGLALPASAALHVFTAGVVGAMVLGIMTRASLGHTGRPLVVPRAIAIAYALVLLGALLRVLGPLAPAAHYTTAMTIAGAAWSTGFVIFTLRFAPILLRPRVDLSA